MSRKFLIKLCILIASLLLTAGISSASFTDVAIDWDLFLPPDGYTIPYTFNGQPVSDEESSSDSTNGGTAVSPSSIDLSSGSPNSSDPGPYEKPKVHVIDLAADEVLAIGCKTMSGGFNVGASPCTANSCSTVGS